MVGQTEPSFRFKQFEIVQDRSTMKVGTDGVLLGAWVQVDDAKKVLDVGTGTGVIAIMLGQRNEQAEIFGIDIDPDSAEQAAANMAAAPWKDRLQALPVSVQSFAREHPPEFDLIVSNPPFFSGGTFSDKAERNQVRHTIKLPHGDLLRAVQQLLAPEGTFAVILPLIEGLRFEELAQSYQFSCSRKCEVRSRPSKPVERLLLEFKRQPGPEMVREELVLQEDTGQDAWTESYRALCRDFYLYF